MRWVQKKRGRLLPDKDNYVCKGDYALPFAEKWCVWAGGVTPALSTDWSEAGDRFNYYFILLGDEAHEGDETAIENYLSYGKNVLAAADGTVAKVCNKHTDTLGNKEDELINHTGSWDVVGNHIILRHAKNKYSVVGNLRQNSLAVKVGDAVKRGQILAQCGNSGYITEEPCLYFHLTSSKNFYMANSLPIAFTNIQTSQSSAFHTAHKNENMPVPSTQGNVEMVGNKTYIGRGLDVENIV
ncbi:MAG: M23 family metallopeptidase [Defluviitaleaceae bacterium]|nr:M23 family metallopeptidase [Defluviitaleaceae bacterium]MCL2275288.1 M23 family metallopeptidase [Defluviitaleaceae bacterium]